MTDIGWGLQLDMRTLVVTLTMLIVVTTAVHGALFLSGLRYPSSRTFFFAYVCSTIGTFGSFYRDFMPMSVSVVMSNLGYWAFLLLIYRGQAHLTDQPRRSVLADALLLLGLTLVQLLLLLSPDTLTLRIVLFTLVAMVIEAMNIRLLWRVQDAELRPIMRFQVVGVGFLLVISVIRLFLLLTQASDVMIGPSIMVLLTFLGFFVFIIVNTVGNMAFMVIRNEQALSLAATIDPLTGVFNRRAFDPTVAREMSRRASTGGSLSLLVLDLDHFKAVNDRFGHKTGDDVLRAVAGRIRECLTGFDTLARLGGEEFVVLLPECDAERAALVADGILEAIRSQPVTGRHEEAVHITLSIGGATLAGTDATPWPLFFERADRALYQAKAKGRNRAVFAPSPVMADRRQGPTDRRASPRPEST